MEGLQGGSMAALAVGEARAPPDPPLDPPLNGKYYLCEKGIVSPNGQAARIILWFYCYFCIMIWNNEIYFQFISTKHYGIPALYTKTREHHIMCGSLDLPSLVSLFQVFPIWPLNFSFFFPFVALLSGPLRTLLWKKLKLRGHIRKTWKKKSKEGIANFKRAK